jgi:hypothetical protein
MNTSVTLRATGIEVTASNESQAIRYLLEDGRQFRSSWEYELSHTDRTDEDEDDADDVRVEAETSEPEGEGERTWTGNVLFTVVVEGEPSDEDAFEAAKAVLAD